MPEPKEIKADSRIDESGLNVFVSMGYDSAKLPDSLVLLYNTVKRKKDIVYPSRMGAEACAIIAALSDMLDKRGEYAVAPEKTKKSDKGE